MSREYYLSLSDKSCEYIVYSGFALPLLQVEELALCGGFLLVGTDGILVSFPLDVLFPLFNYCTLNYGIVINNF